MMEKFNLNTSDTIKTSPFYNSKQREVDPVPPERPTTPREPVPSPEIQPGPDVTPIPQTNPMPPPETPQVIPHER